MTEVNLYNYFGTLNQNVLKMIIDIHESYLSASKISRGLSRRIITTIIEATQNIIIHNQSSADKAKSGVKTKMSGDAFEFVFENVVAENDVEMIKKITQQVKSLSLDEQKAYYRSKLAENSNSSPNLGLMLIGMNCGNNFSISFNKTENNSYLFGLKVNIKKEN